MPTPTSRFVLDVRTDPESDIVRLRLTDEPGNTHLGANQVRLSEHSSALWQGLFDTRSFVDTYANSVQFTDRPETAADLFERIGVFLGEKVLGLEILAALHAGTYQRSLLVRISPEDRNAAAFARVAWEMARPAPGQEALFERNLVVRLETPGVSSTYTPPLPGPDEHLRVLLVYAEAPGSRPLAMRLEREQLLALFYDKVMPNRRVSVDVLCHGVTRKSLSEKVRDAAGYHVVHWSGHGHHNLLELVGEDGRQDLLTGAGLVELFEGAGGFIPHLVFLSACLSGTLAGVRNKAALEAALLHGETTRRSAPEQAEPGYTGTALALLDANVPQVLAMRYEVGDAYALDLAGLFYRRLFADSQPKSPASALAVARKELLDRKAPEHDAVDHATPLLFGRDAGPLPAPKGRSDALALRRPRPQPLLTDSRELDRPAELVGRGEPLSRLRRCLEEGKPAVALVQGLAGLGKTALVAEAIHLWHSRFDGVFAFQSKPLPVSFDDFLRRLDERLALHSQTYRELCEQNPYAAVHLPAGKQLSGEARWRKMRDNLLVVMQSERLLLVLDNFETHLERVAGSDGYACEDPEWDRVLRHLVENLPGSGSRLIVTSRHKLAAVADPERALWLLLGPLPMPEAVLFIQGSEALRRLAFGDEAGRKLALRLLEVSRGHPLILSRLGALSDDPKALSQVLDELEAKGLDRLPDIFAPLSEAQRKQERAYLEDVAVGSVDLLIHRASPPGRRLLWLVTLAMEPATEELIQGVWLGRSLEEEQTDQVRALLAMEEQLPEELREALSQIPPEVRAALEQESGAASVRPVGPLLAELTAAGLLTVEEGGVYGFHELVRERAAAWIEDHPEEKGGRTEEQVWVAYGERYAAAFNALMQSAGEGSRERAVEAGRRGISYLVRARTFDRLGSFASNVVLSTQDPRLLRRVIAELEGVVEQVPAGEARWSLRTYLADALDNAGRSVEALPFYEQAVAEAEEAGDWNDVGWICQNWAIALVKIGRLDDARSTYLLSAEAYVKAGSPRINVLASECEALRVDIMQAEAEQALPEVESRLEEVRNWWRRHREGEPVPEAPNPAILAWALIGGLDIAREANLALEQWEACLGVLTEIEETQQAFGEGEHALARTRFNRYGPLLRLGRLDEAQRVLESCLAAFRGASDLASEGATFSALANLWDQRGDREQAAGLARQALAVSNRLANLEGRSISHGNLANYLEHIGEVEEAARHLQARIVYDLVTGHRQLLATAMHRLMFFMSNAAALGKRYELPRLAELLTRPEFEPLQRTLTEWNVPLDALQTQIDQHVEAVRRRVEEEAAAGGNTSPEGGESV
ncbi:MAG TPA: CHAT domain-containing protein [Thermoanaerobaculia bacterium]|nr:CHAT domain-containing protein [Thermoanaerobaculia bacterium]